MELRPLAGHIFVEYVPTVAESTIAIPENVKKDLCSGGKIVAVASYRLTRGGQKRPMVLERHVGQYCFFKPRTADVFSVKDTTYYNVNEDHVLVTVDTLEEFRKVIMTSK